MSKKTHTLLLEYLQVSQLEDSKTPGHSIRVQKKWNALADRHEYLENCEKFLKKLLSETDANRCPRWIQCYAESILIRKRN